MKPAVLLALVVLVVATGRAVAEHLDQINLYSDPDFTSKEALDRAPGTLRVFVVHEDPNANDMTAVWFKIVASNGFTGVWVSETTQHYFIGTSPVGIQIAYRGCLTLPALTLEVTYATVGTSEDCSYLEVVAHPDDCPIRPDPPPRPCDGPLTVNCYFDFGIAPGGRLTINPNETCSPVPVESTTWGRVKALYR